LWSGYRTRSLLSVGEQADSAKIIKELLCEENLHDDYRLYELFSKPQDIFAGMDHICHEIFVYKPYCVAL